MHVGLNLLHLVPRETGGSELYARRLVPALLEAEPRLRLTLFAAAEGAPSLAAEPWAGAVRVVRLPVRARSRPRRVLAEQLLLPVAAHRHRVDLLHNLFSTAPAAATVPQVTTVLDVIYRRFPETHAGLLSRGMALLVPLAARRSRRVIAISEAGRDDIVRFLGTAFDRVDVTPLGPGLPTGITPVPGADLRRRFGLGDRPVVLTVSAKRPHKNLGRLIEAMGAVQDLGDPHLVVPGYATPFEAELREEAEALLGDVVRFTGWVTDEELEGLYREADAFVFPSLAEGFGLPVLEAMLRGTPVACSNTTSLPEVAGDGALLFDPAEVGEIAAAIRDLLTDSALRKRLVGAAAEQASRFTWAETAHRTLAAYRRALGEPAAASSASTV